MPGSKKSYLKSQAGPKLLRTRLILRILIVALMVFVVYDSFKHQTPLYYILFFLLGRVVGVIYRLVFSVEKPEEEKFELNANQWNILLTLFLILLHFLWGEPLLESLNVVWATNAIYLFFIGLYITKLKIITTKIDEIIYAYILKKNSKP